MRYKHAENTWILGRFDTGLTVTIAVYDLSDDSELSLSTNSCSEVGTTGTYKWNVSNIMSKESAYKEYLWIMTASNGVIRQGKYVSSGWPDEQTGKHYWDRHANKLYIYGADKTTVLYEFDVDVLNGLITTITPV